MTRGRGRAWRGLIALPAAGGLWLLAGASPASAYVCAFSIDSPTAGSVAGSPDIHVTGSVDVQEGLGAERSLAVSFLQSPGPRPGPVIRRGGDVGPAGRYDVAIGPLSRNGQYTVQIVAGQIGPASALNCDGGLGPERRDLERSGQVTFGVSVQAKPPSNVRARFDAQARTVTVTWDRSSDPDVAGYTVSRKVGAGDPVGVDVRPDPQSWTDTNLPAGSSTLVYSVQASRAGPRPNTTSVPSAPVSAAPVNVPAPPPGTPPPTSAGAPQTTAPFALGRPVGGGAATTPTTAAAPASSAAAGAPAGPGGAPSTEPPTSTGAGDPLPLPAASGDVTLEGAAPPDGGNGQALAGRPRGGGGSDGRRLAYGAAGVLSTLGAAQVLRVRRRSGRGLVVAGAGPHTQVTALEPVAIGASGSALDPGVVDPSATSLGAPAAAGRRSARAQDAAAAGAILRSRRSGPPGFEPTTAGRRPLRAARPPAGPVPAPVAVGGQVAQHASAPLDPPPGAGVVQAASTADQEPPRSERRSRRQRRAERKAAAAEVAPAPVPVEDPPEAEEPVADEGPILILRLIDSGKP